jgi:hypothetical protein
VSQPSIPTEHLNALRNHFWTHGNRFVAVERVRPQDDGPSRLGALAALGSDAACSVYGIYGVSGDSRPAMVVVSHPKETMCNRLHLDGLQAILSIPSSFVLPPAIFLVATAAMMNLMAGAHGPEGSPSHAAEVAAIRSAHVRTAAMGAGCIALAMAIDVGGLPEAIDRVDPGLTAATTRAALFAATLLARTCIRWINGAQPSHRVIELDDA